MSSLSLSQLQSTLLIFIYFRRDIRSYGFLIRGGCVCSDFGSMEEDFGKEDFGACLELVTWLRVSLHCKLTRIFLIFGRIHDFGSCPPTGSSRFDRREFTWFHNERKTSITETSRSARTQQYVLLTCMNYAIQNRAQVWTYTKWIM